MSDDHTHYIKVKDQYGKEHYIECEEHHQSSDSKALETAASIATISQLVLSLVSRGKKKKA